MKNPRQLPAGDSPRVSSLSGSEVALSANVQVDRALVLELVKRGRLRSSGGEHRAARHLLVEVEPHHFGRERQVLDRSPAGDHTHLSDVEVGVARVGASVACNTGVASMRRCESGASQPTVDVIRSSVPMSAEEEKM